MISIFHELAGYLNTIYNTVSEKMHSKFYTTHLQRNLF